MIWGIPSREIPDHADRLAPFLDNFAARSLGRWTAARLFCNLAAADRQAWVADDFQAVCITALGGHRRVARGRATDLWLYAW